MPWCNIWDGKIENGKLEHEFVVGIGCFNETQCTFISCPEYWGYWTKTIWVRENWKGWKKMNEDIFPKEKQTNEIEKENSNEVTMIKKKWWVSSIISKLLRIISLKIFDQKMIGLKKRNEWKIGMKRKIWGSSLKWWWCRDDAYRSRSLNVDKSMMKSVKYYWWALSEVISWLYLRDELLDSYILL